MEVTHTRYTYRQGRRGRLQLQFVKLQSFSFSICCATGEVVKFCRPPKARNALSCDIVPLKKPACHATMLTDLSLETLKIVARQALTLTLDVMNCDKASSCVFSSTLCNVVVFGMPKTSVLKVFLIHQLTHTLDLMYFCKL